MKSQNPFPHWHISKNIVFTHLNSSHSLSLSLFHLLLLFLNLFTNKNFLQMKSVFSEFLIFYRSEWFRSFFVIFLLYCIYLLYIKKTKIKLKCEWSNEWERIMFMYVCTLFHHLWMAHLIATCQSALPFDCLSYALL
jgi:hypothetical protein